MFKKKERTTKSYIPERSIQEALLASTHLQNEKATAGVLHCTGSCFVKQPVGTTSVRACVCVGGQRGFFTWCPVVRALSPKWM